MRFKFKSFIFLGIFITASLMATGPRVSPNLISVKKNVIYALDLPPFISTEIVHEGVLSEIVITSFAQQGIEVIINIVPLQSMINHYLVEENALGVMGRHLGIGKNMKKELVSVPLFVSPEHYVYYKPLNKKLSDEEIRSNKIKFTYGASTGEDVSVFNKTAMKVKKSRTFSMFKKLKRGKVDFVSMPIQSAQWYIQNKYTDEKNDFVIMDGISKEVPIELYFNLKNAEGKKLFSAFKKGLKSIVKSGQYVKILEKYIQDQTILKSQEEYLKSILE